MSDKTITLSLEEAIDLLDTLSQLPYKEVFQAMTVLAHRIKEATDAPGVLVPDKQIIKP